jgi:hypothetical protein
MKKWNWNDPITKKFRRPTNYFEKNLLSGLIEFKEMLTIEFVESRNLEISVKFSFA